MNKKQYKKRVKKVYKFMEMAAFKLDAYRRANQLGIYDFNHTECMETILIAQDMLNKAKTEINGYCQSVPVLSKSLIGMRKEKLND